MNNYLKKTWNAAKYPALATGMYFLTEGGAELFQGPVSIEHCPDTALAKHVPASTNIYSAIFNAHKDDTLRFGDRTLLITDIVKNDPAATGVESDDINVYMTGYDTKTGKRIDINKYPIAEGKNVVLNGGEGTLTLGEVFNE